MGNETTAGATTDAVLDAPGGADAAAEQMAAATEALRAKLPLLHGEPAPVDPYPV